MLQFVCRLALALGWASPRNLADALSLEDVALWQAYAEREPWGEERADYRAAIVAYTTWAGSFSLAGKRPPRNVSVEDFLVVPGERSASPKITDPAQMESLFAGIHAQMQEVKHGAS